MASKSDKKTLGPPVMVPLLKYQAFRCINIIIIIISHYYIVFLVMQSKYFTAKILFSEIYLSAFEKKKNFPGVVERNIINKDQRRHSRRLYVQIYFKYFNVQRYTNDIQARKESPREGKFLYTEFKPFKPFPTI